MFSLSPSSPKRSLLSDSFSRHLRLRCSQALSIPSGQTVKTHSARREWQRPLPTGMRSLPTGLRPLATGCGRCQPVRTRARPLERTPAADAHRIHARMATIDKSNLDLENIRPVPETWHAPRGAGCPRAGHGHGLRGGGRRLAKTAQMRSFSIWSLRVWILPLSWDPSLVVTDAAITGRDTPHARPSACTCPNKSDGS
jgi:hypothetical protein